MPIEFAPPSPSLQGFQIPAPQSTDPLQTLAQIGQLRTQGLQQQGAQQELEMGQLKQQQAQEDFADQQKLRQVYGSWLQSGNPKLDDLVTQAGAAGVGPRTLMPLQQQITEQRQKLATAKEAEFKNTVSAQAQNTQAFNAVASAPSDQRPAAWQTERGKLIAGGFAGPNDIPPDYPGDAAFEELRHHNRTQEQELAIAKDQRDAGLVGAQTAEAKQKVDVGERAQAVAEVQAADVDPQTGAPTPAAMAAIQQRHPKVVLPRGPASKDDIARLIRSTVDTKDQPEFDIKTSQAQAMQAFRSQNPAQIDQLVDRIVPPTDPMNSSTKVLLHNLAASGGTMEQVQQVIKDAYDQRGRVQVAKESAQNKVNIDLGSYARQLTGDIGGGPGDQHGDAYLSTLSPAFAARVKGIATGNEALPTGRAAMSGPGALLANAVYRYDPDYTPLLGQKRRTELQDFSKTGPGSAGGNVVALQTMIHHADLYQETADALQNGTFKPGNAVWNAVKDAFGAAPPTSANLVAQFFAGETAKVAGEQSQGEVNKILESLKSSNSPEQIRGAGQTLLRIASGRLVPYQERIADAKLQNLAPPLIGPSERAILQRRGFDPNTMQPVKAGAGAPPIPDSIPAQFRSTTHYSPSQKKFYYTTDGGKTWLTVPAQ